MSPHIEDPEQILLYYFWAFEVVLEKYPWRDHIVFPPEMTKKEWLYGYLIRAACEKILHVFGKTKPEALVLVRKLDSAKIRYYSDNYYQTLLEQDPDGDIAWVDYCYAPGNYAYIIPFLKSLKTDFIAWERNTTGKLHIVPSAEMPESVKEGSLGKPELIR